MKKLFTLVIALFAMICVNAQVTFLYEQFESNTLPTGWTIVDADGDSYNWDVSTPYTVFTCHSGVGCIASASYVNNVGALTPDNWLITPQVTISANDTLAFWVAGQDASYAAENFGVYVSTTGTNTSDFTSVYQGTSTDTYTRIAISMAAYAGQNVYIAFRHYNTTDMYWLNLDDVTLGSLPTTPTITSMPTAAEFGTISIGETKDVELNFSGYSLTSPVTVTTAAPFAVSADGTTFGTTATINVPVGAGTITNGSFFVRFAPTAATTSTGTATVSSPDFSNYTINLTGTGLDCSQTSIPYTFAFDDEGMAQCWTIVDNNNDGSTFTISTGSGYAYYIYSEDNNADDWLISPVFNLTGQQQASFSYACASSSFPEAFEVYAINANNESTLLVERVNVTNASEYNTQNIYLGNLTGAYKIGIKCVSDADAYALLITNFSVSQADGIEEQANDTRIYPNPANNVLNIQASSNINTVEVFNAMGQKVAAYDANDTYTTINTSNLTAGVYTVRISTENGVANQKFMVAR